MSDLTKIRAGLYWHQAAEQLIIKTYEWEGPRGGSLSRWEHAHYEGSDICIDGASTLYKTLREAVEALFCAACSHYHSGPCLCPECGKPASSPGGTCGRCG